MAKSLQNAYNQFVSQGVNIGSYEKFSAAMQDPQRRKTLYNIGTTHGVKLGSYNDFSSIVTTPTPTPQNAVSKTNTPAPQKTAPQPQKTTSTPNNQSWLAAGLSHIHGVPSLPTSSPQPQKVQIPLRGSSTPQQAPTPKKQIPLFGAFNNPAIPTVSPSALVDDGTLRKRYEAEHPELSINDKLSTKTEADYQKNKDRLANTIIQERKQEKDFEKRQGDLAKLHSAAETNAASKAWENASTRLKALTTPAKTEKHWYDMFKDAEDNEMQALREQMDYDAKRMQEFDLQKLRSDTWNNLGKETQDKHIADYFVLLKEQYPNVDDYILQDYAKRLARSQSDKSLYDYAVKQNMPKSALEFIAKHIIDTNLIHKLSEGTLRLQAGGKTGDMSAREAALGKYAQNASTVTNVAATVLGMAADPTTYIAGGAGGLVTKTLTKGVGRYLASGLTERILTGAAGASANMATYEGLGEFATQFQHGVYSLSDITKKIKHGATMGAAIGWITPLSGNISDKLVSNTAGTINKMMTRSGVFVGSTVLEGTIFSVPEWLEGKEDAYDVWTNNMAMMVGFKASHIYKTAKNYLGDIEKSFELPKNGAKNRLDFLSRWRMRVDSPSDGGLSLTNSEKAELKKFGYDFWSVYKGAKKTGNPKDKQVATLDAPEIVSKLTELVYDQRISEAARAKMYYFATGRRLPVSTIMHGELADNGNGTFTVNSVGANGVITSRTFGNRKSADLELERINRQAELNQIEIGERFRKSEDFTNRLYEACKKVGEVNGWNPQQVYNVFVEVKEKAERGNEKLSKAEQSIFERVNAVFDGRNSSEVVDNLIKRVNETYGVDVDEAIRKDFSRRTFIEQQAIDEYIRSLYPEERPSTYANATDLTGQRELAEGDVQSEQAVDVEQPVQPLDNIEQRTEPSQPKEYKMGEEVDVLYNGTPMRAIIQQKADADGKMIVRFESEDGTMLGVGDLTKEELDAMAMREGKTDVETPNSKEDASETTDSNLAEAGANSNTPTPLSRIPHNEKGEPIFEQAESPEVAWDALVEYSGGDASTAKEIADAMAEEKRKALESAQKLKLKGKTPAEMLASKKANAEALAKAEAEYNHWQQVANVEQSRQEAERARQEEEARRVEAERAEEEAQRKAEEEALVRAEEERAEEKRKQEEAAKVEAEKLAKQKAREEREAKRKAKEEAIRKKAEEEEAAKRKAAEEAEKNAPNIDEKSTRKLGKVSEKGVDDSEMPTDMAYRTTDVNEVADILESGVMREMPEGASVEGGEKTHGGFQLGRTDGRSHGGKGFSKGKVWKSTTAGGTAQKVVIGVPGDKVQWQVGMHGRYGKPKPFREIEDGKAVMLKFNDRGEVEGVKAEDMRFWVQGRDGKYYELKPNAKTEPSTAEKSATKTKKDSERKQEKGGESSKKDGNVDRSARTDGNTTSVDFPVKDKKASEDVANAFGYKVEWLDTDSKDNGRVDHEKKVIYIAKDAEMPIKKVFGHETTHIVKQADEGSYNALRDAAVKVVGEEEMGKRLEEKRNEIDQQTGEHAYSEEKVEEEVVGDIVGETLDSEDRLRDLANALKDKPSILARIRDLLLKLKDAVAKLLHGGAEADKIRARADILDTILKAARRDGFNESVSDKTLEELESHGMTMSGGTVMSNRAAEIKEKTGYLTPNERIDRSAKTIGRTLYYLHQANAPESTISVLESWENRLAARDAAAELVHRFTPQTDTPIKQRYNKDGSFKSVASKNNSPVRPQGDIYHVSFDIDTTCPRTFLQTTVRNEIERRLGMPLTFKQAIQLTEVLRAYNLEIPCTYCYVENKRQAKVEAFFTYSNARNGVFKAETEAEELAAMYGHTPTAKDPNRLTPAASKKLAKWREQKADGMKYRPTMQQLFSQYSTSRDSALYRLDELAGNGAIDKYTSVPVLTKKLMASFSGKVSESKHIDKQALTNIKGELKEIATEWKSDMANDRRHDDYDPMRGRQGVFIPEAVDYYRDMTLYGASSSQAKKVMRYVPYTNELSLLPKSEVAYLNSIDGIRLHGNNDFRLDYTTDYNQFFADATARGLKAQTYTKNPDFIEVYGNTGIKINMSIAAYGGTNGQKVMENQSEGMSWAKAKELSEKYPNAGAMMMVTNSKQLSFALNTPWIYMAIPFHASDLKKEVWKDMRAWYDYSYIQNESLKNSETMRKELEADGVSVGNDIKPEELRREYNQHFGIKEYWEYNKKAKAWELSAPHFLPGEHVEDGPNGKQIIPGHGNDRETYLGLCKEYGVKPRFYGEMVEDKNGNTIEITQHPEYMKVIKEVGRTDTPQTAVDYGRMADIDENAPIIDEHNAPIIFGGNVPDGAIGRHMTSAEWSWFKLYDFAKRGGYGSDLDYEQVVKTSILGVGKEYDIAGKFIDEYVKKDRPIGWLMEDARLSAEIANKAIIEEYGKMPYEDRSAEDNNGKFSKEKDDIRFRLLADNDPKVKALEALPKGELVPVYRNVQVFSDDALGSPMAFFDAETGERRTLAGGRWNYSEAPKVELTEEQQRKLDELNKNSYLMVDGKKTTELPISDSLKFVKPKTKEAQLQYLLKKNPEDSGTWAAYDPYDHAIETPLNTQFAEAYKRPNLVVVRSLIPKSEITEPFQADYALLPTGAHQWNNGRTLYLSRYSKIDKVLSRKEEAELIDKYWKEHDGKREALKSHRDYNRFVPEVRKELENMGYRFELDGKELTPEESLALDKQRETEIIPGREGRAPYITGEDIDRINAKMAGKWVGEPKEAMEDEMAARVEDLSKKLNTPVRIVRTDEEVEAMPTDRQRRQKGSYNTRTGEVTIVVPNNANLADVENTFMHEVVGHDGLRVLFPEKEKLDNALDELYGASNDSIKASIDRGAQKMYDAEVERLLGQKRSEAEARAEADRKRDQFKRDATEEYGADLAGRIGDEGFEKMSAEEKTFWGKLKAVLQKALDALLHGLKIPGKRKWGDKDWAYVLHEAYKRKRNGGRPSVFDVTDTEAMREKTGFGESIFSRRDKKSALTNEAALKHLRPFGIEHDTKVQQKLENAKKELVKISKKYRDTTNSRGLITDLQIGLGLNVHDTGSGYGSFKSTNGRWFTIRISNHNIGTSNIKDLPVVSIIIKAQRSPNRFKARDGKFADEYTYFKEDISNAPVGTLSSIVDSIYNLLDTGRFEDKTGLAKHSHSPERTSDEGVMFRDGSPVKARDIYEKKVKSSRFQAREALQDSMLGLKTMMESVMKGEGKRRVAIEDIPDFENPYLGENRLSSVNQAQQKRAGKELFLPVLKEMRKLTGQKSRTFGRELEQETLDDYLFAKHGLERDKVLREREAHEQYEKYKKATPNGAKTEADFYNRLLNKDYAGLTELMKDDVNVKGLQDQIDQLTEQRDAEKDSTLKARLTRQIEALEYDIMDARRQAAADYVDFYENDHDTTNLWKSINALNKATLEVLRDTGVISEDQFNEISGMYQNYIPLRGFDQKTSHDAYDYISTQGFSGVSSPIKEAKGRRSKADNPLAYMESMYETAVIQGNRNALVKQKTLNFVLNHPSDVASVSKLWLKYDQVADEWNPVFPDNIDPTDSPKEVTAKMQAFEQQMEQLSQKFPDLYKSGKQAENIPFKVVTKADKAQHQIIAKVNGVSHIITINGDPRAALAVNGHTNPNSDLAGAIGKIMDKAQVLNRQLSSFYTTRNPDFIMSNFVRDAIYANTMVWVKESPKYAGLFNLNYGKLAVPGVMTVLLEKYELGKLGKTDVEKDFAEFMANGGETGYSSMKDIEKRKTAIRRELKAGRHSLGKGLHWTAEQLDILNRSAENAARFAAYRTSRQKGRSVGRSIWDAKQISVNFNKKGAGGTFLDAKNETFVGRAASFISGTGGSFYVFWNAGVQGLTNIISSSAKHPVKAIALAALLFGIGYGVSTLMAKKEDEDDANYYDISKFVRRSNICSVIGDKCVSVPLPVEYRVMYGLGELAGSVATGNEPGDTWDWAYEAAAQITQALPLDALEAGNPYIPSMIKPIWEAQHNKDWTGRPLYKDNDFNKNMPEYTKVYSNANPTLVGSAKWLNEVGGGDDYTPARLSWMDINPAKVEYILKGYFGGAATFADHLVKLTTGGADDMRNWPVVTRFVRNVDERTRFSSINSQYYNLKNEVDITQQRLKGYTDAVEKGDTAYLQKLQDLYNSPEYTRLVIFKEFKKSIKEIQDLIKETDDPETKLMLQKQQSLLQSKLLEATEKAVKK